MTLYEIAKKFRDAFLDDPGIHDLDDEQPITVSVTLGDWRRLNMALHAPEATASKALTLLQQAADGLYNGFEPDNQSALWLRINAFLKSEGLVTR